MGVNCPYTVPSAWLGWAKMGMGMITIVWHCLNYLVQSWCAALSLTPSASSGDFILFYICSFSHVLYYDGFYFLSVFFLIYYIRVYIICSSYNSVLDYTYICNKVCRLLERRLVICTCTGYIVFQISVVFQCQMSVERPGCALAFHQGILHLPIISKLVTSCNRWYSEAFTNLETNLIIIKYSFSIVPIL
jgi:hypothetical protein